MLLQSRLLGAVEGRISNPRGNRYPKYAKLMAAWKAQNPGVNTEFNYPGKIPKLLIDRRGSTVYGLFWNNRLLKLGKTVWTSPEQAVATFNNYVHNVIAMLSEDDRNALPEELVAFAKERGHKGVKEISKALRECGALQVREIETIPMPPDEED
jgi:hypothetical protein